MGFAFSQPTPPRPAFIGREQERLFLLEGLRGGKRLITIVGLPGVGKSRLVEELIEGPAREREEAAAALPPIHYIDLAAIADSPNLEVEIAQALGIQATGTSEIEASLGARGPLVVILDNVDGLAADLGPIVQGWLERCPELQLIATSVAPLGLQSEARIELGPLPLAEACTLYLDGLQRAGLGRGDLPESSITEELVSQLDRLPLAIELASSIARILPPDALLQRISRRLEVLGSPRPGRHASLRAALDRALDLLPPDPARVLAQVSAFDGGFSLDAAQAIVGGERPEELLHLLEELRTRGLIEVAGSAQHRFSLPVLVRELAAIRLREDPFEAEVRMRHARWFADQGEQRAQELEGPEARNAVLWFGTERQNLLAAHLQARSRDPAVSVRAGLALASAFRIQPPLASERPFLESLVQTARDADDELALVQALRLVGVAQASLALSEAAASSLEEALRLSRALRSPLEEGLTLVELSTWVLLPRRDFDRARRDLERGLAIAREQGDQLLEGLVRMRMGVLEGMRFDFEASETWIREALSIFRRGGHRFQEGRSLSNLCRVYRGLGRIRQERQVLQEALEIVRELGDRVAEANYLQHQGASELVLGNLDEAEILITRSLELHDRHTSEAQRARTLGLLGILALLRGEPKDGIQRLLEAITRAEAGHESLSRAQFLPFFAAAAALLGRRDEARESLDDARLALQQVGEPSADELCDLVEGILELSEARRLAANQQEEEAASLERAARARLAQAERPAYGSKEFVNLAIQLLEKLLAKSADFDGPRTAGEVLVGRDGAWIEPEGGKRIHLRRRTSLRRLLMALLHQRRVAPEIGLSCNELFAAAWPGEEIRPDSIKARVYTAIWTLRSFGIPIVLTGKGEGYILDPKASIRYLG